MKLAELQHAGRAPLLPLVVELPDGNLRLLSLLRVLPGQRYVGEAEWRGQRVLAKVFVGAKAQRHHARECEGARWLHDQGLPTPRLLAEGCNEQGGWVLFEFLAEAVSLAAEWHAAQDASGFSAAQQRIAQVALAAIGVLHSRGLWQDDLHLDNLLRHAGQLLWIDGGGVCAETVGQPLSAAQALENLGTFFAQLPVEVETHLDALLPLYQATAPHTPLNARQLHEPIARQRQWRLRDFIKKTVRDCTLFHRQCKTGSHYVGRREWADDVFPILENADAVIARGESLKQGGSATVVRVKFEGRWLVIKRYNLKNTWHWLKRCWRPTRAWHSWIEGNRLDFLGISTPKPLAVREERRFGLRGRGWLITEYTGGVDILSHFAGYTESRPPEPQLIALDYLFNTLLRERISHGDFKGTNLFWQNGRWVLIDLDAVQQHRCPRRFARAYAKDRARFLRNWPADSALYQLLDQRLPQVPRT